MKRGKKVAAKKAAAKKVASKAAATQEEKSALRRIRAKRTEHVNLLAKQLQEEANNEGADGHAAGNASSLKDAKQLLLQEDADVQGGSDDGDSDVSLNNGGVSDGEGNVEKPRQGPGKVRLAASCRTEKQDVAFLNLDLAQITVDEGIDLRQILPAHAHLDRETLVVIVNCHRQLLLC